MLAEQGEGLASLCFRTPDISKMHRRLDRLSLKPEPVAEVESRRSMSGAKLSWKRTARQPTGPMACGCFSSNSQESVRARPRPGSADHLDGSRRGRNADPERAAALYGARLGLDMALDRSHPEWGRLMFFRCGDLIVEVAHRPGKEATSGRTGSTA